MMNDQNVRSQLEEMLSAMAVPYSDGPVGVSGWQRRREQSSESLQQCIDELQARLDHLRVSIKYLMFDVEATRRENRSLRRLVEQAYEDHDDEMV